MKYKFVELTQGTPEWLEYRTRGIGASDIPAICGAKGAYGNENDVLISKLYKDRKVELSDYTKNIFEIGHQVEEEVRQECLNNLGKYYKPVVIESSQFPHLFASLDGISDDFIDIIEVKTTRKKDYIDQVKTGTCPEVYLYQIQYQLFVSGLTRCTLIVVDVNTRERYPLIISRDENLIIEIVNKANSFYQRMLTETSPLKELDLYDEQAMRLEATLHSIAAYSERIDELEKRKKMLSELLLDRYKARKLENARLSIQLIESQGSVNYKAIPELKGVDLDQYRGKPKTSLRVTLKGETKS